MVRFMTRASSGTPASGGAHRKQEGTQGAERTDMATATVQLGASAGAPVISRECVECEQPIHPMRLKRHPFTSLCARCQEVAGDVEVLRDCPLTSVYGQADYGREEVEVVAKISTGGLAEVTVDQPSTSDEFASARNTGHCVQSGKGREARSEKMKEIWRQRRAAAAN